MKYNFVFAIKIFFLGSVRRLLVTASVIPSLPILVILMKGGAKFLRNVGYYKSTRRNIPEDAILHSHCRENLKSYMILN
jgi:hypothetical protein